MDYNKLKTFLVVAQRNSITQAARELGRTQSAITQQIQLLEEGLGMALLERRNARVFLTKEGEALRKAGHALLGQLDDEVLRLKESLALLEGELRVGVLEDFNVYRLSPSLSRFREAHPRVRLSLVHATSHEIESLLVASAIDVGLLFSFRDRSFFEIHPLCTDDHILVTSPRYLERHGPIRSVERLLTADLVDFTSDFLCLGTWVKKNAPSLLSTLEGARPAVVLQSHLGIKALLESGFGVAILPDYVVSNELHRGDLVQILKTSKPVRVGMDLAVRKTRSPRLVEERFIAFLRNEQWLAD